MSIIAPTMVGPGKKFKTKALRRLEDAILHLVLANNRAILLIFQAEYTETMLDILSYPESTIRSTMVGQEKISK